MTITPLPAMTEGVDAWTDAQEKGGWWGTLPAAPAEAAGLRRRPTLRPSAGTRNSTAIRSVSAPLPAVSIESSFSTARWRILPWLQEMPIR